MLCSSLLKAAQIEPTYYSVDAPGENTHLDSGFNNQEAFMGHGGKRPGAGRPKGVETVSVRLPKSMLHEVKQLAKTRGLKLPLYSARVQAGYPMPADDHIEDRIDLSQYLVEDPEETFLVRAAGDSMIDAGIKDGTLLVVNRKLQPKNGRIVVAAIDGQVTVKYLIMKKGKPFLMPANPAYREIPIDTETGAVIWGVVTSSIQLH